MKPIFLRVDSRNRISLTKLIKEDSAIFYRAYIENGKIILEPAKELEEENAWIFAPENKHILERLKESIKQKGDIDRGSFKKYLK